MTTVENTPVGTLVVDVFDADSKIGLARHGDRHSLRKA